VTADPRRISDSRGYETSAGVESFLTPLTTGRFSLGFRNESYEAAGARRYRGAVFRGEIQKEFSETVRAGLSFTRHTNLSNFQQNAFYLTHGLAIAYMHELGPKVFFRVGPGFQRNSYPLPLLDEPGVPRELVGRSSRIDRIYTLDCGIRYRHRDMLALEILFDAMRRDSNLPGHSFTNYRVGVSLLIGHRGMAAGRFFY